MSHCWWARGQVVSAMAGKVGADRVGVRFGPYNSFNSLAASYPGDDDFYIQVTLRTHS